MKRFAFTLALFVATATAALAQLGSSGGPGINAALLKLFGETKAFSAKADVRTLDKDQKEIASLPMQIALLDGKLRAEMDLSQMKSDQMPPNAAAMLKQTGMDKMISIVRPDKQATFVIYPGMQGYTEIAMSKDDVPAENAKLDTTVVGKETIDGHPCVKNKVVTTDSKGRTHEAFVWNATDLKNFPIQMQVNEAKNTLVLRYLEPKFDKPDAKIFDAPDGYTKHASLQQLMQAAMMKMLGGGGGK